MGAMDFNQVETCLTGILGGIAEFLNQLLNAVDG